MKFHQYKDDLTNRSTDNQSQHYSFAFIFAHLLIALEFPMKFSCILPLCTNSHENLWVKILINFFDLLLGFFDHFDFGLNSERCTRPVWTKFSMRTAHHLH